MVITTTPVPAPGSRERDQHGATSLNFVTPPENEKLESDPIERSRLQADIGTWHKVERVTVQAQQTFPEIIHRMVTECTETNPDIMSWTHNGEAFTVHDTVSADIAAFTWSGT